MAVTVTRGLSGSSAFARQLKDAGAKAIQPALREVAEMAVGIAEEVIAENTVHGGQQGRRRAPGERHLSGSIDYSIRGSTFPFRIIIYSHARDEKVEAVEKGTVAHRIVATRAPRLRFPDSRTAQWRMVKSVKAPALPAHAPMATGLARAVQVGFARARAAR